MDKARRVKQELIFLWIQCTPACPHRFNEPLGPLAILPKRRKQQVLVGSAFSTDVFDHDKNLPRSKRKKRRPWL